MYIAFSLRDESILTIYELKNWDNSEN